MSTTAVAVLLATSACVTARPGQEPLVSDRPDFTEAAETLEPGRVQLEGGHTFARKADETANTTGEVLLRVGIAPRAELRIEPGSYTSLTAPLADVRGREDGALGMKLRLHDAPEDRRSIVPALSVVLATTVPTGSAVYRQHALQPELKLVSGWAIGERVGFAVNANVARPVDDGERFTELAGSASLGIGLTSRLGTYAEVFAFAPQRDGAPRTHFANGGFTASLTPSFQLDVRAGVGLDGNAPDYFVGAGFARRW